MTEETRPKFLEPELPADGIYFPDPQAVERGDTPDLVYRKIMQMAAVPLAQFEPVGRAGYPTDT